MIRQLAARRHPHQVLVAALLMLSGLGILVGGPRPGSASAALPEPLVYAWAVLLTAGGALVVGAAVVRDPVTALWLEMVADPPLSLACLTYAVCATGAAGWRAVLPASIITAAAVAFAIRAVQVGRTVRDLRVELGTE